MALRAEGKRVVIADDAPEVVALVSMVLEKRGYTVESYGNGLKALEAIRLNPPDMILLDVIMPGMDGLEVCDTIKNDPSLQSIPVMLITSITAGSDVADGLWKIGTQSDDFLTKPFNPMELAARVDHLVFGTEIPKDLKRDFGGGAQRLRPD